MDGYTSATYGDRIAEVYDRWHGVAQRGDEEAAAAALAALAGPGPALELGIGTAA